MPGTSGVTVVTNARAFYTPRAAAGASGARHSLRPLIFRGPNDQGKPRANMRRDREAVSAHCVTVCKLNLSHTPAVIVRHPVRPPAGRMTGSGGRSRYSEASAMESRGHGVLDASHSRGMTSYCGARSVATPRLSSSAKADDPVSRGVSDGIERPRRTGCPAFAGHDGFV